MSPRFVRLVILRPLISPPPLSSKPIPPLGCLHSRAHACPTLAAPRPICLAFFPLRWLPDPLFLKLAIPVHVSRVVPSSLDPVLSLRSSPLQFCRRRPACRHHPNTSCPPADCVQGAQGAPRVWSSSHCAPVYIRSLRQSHPLPCILTDFVTSWLWQSRCFASPRPRGPNSTSSGAVSSLGRP